MRPHEPLASAQWHARLELGYALRGEWTLPVHRAHQGPLRVQKALYPEGPSVCHHVILHPPGGVAGGDQLEVQAGLAPGAAVLLTTPGAGRWYRSRGPVARQMLRFEVADRAILEWLPQETILFDAALAHLDLQVELEAEAVYMGWELTCLGRTAAGESFRQGLYRPRNRISRAGQLLWQEQGGMRGGDGLLESPAGLAGEPVFGCFLAVGPGTDSALLAACRTIRPTRGQGAVTYLNGVMVARYLGPDSAAGRAYFSALWALLRPALAGRPARPPRIWAT